ncbi:TetR family transcriptional regulator [Agrococcus sp. TSP3-2-1]|uniref:TetR family transcriptional regulator n=1 Tax=Agrococcus sp. TSP3-2-1 TaxID=2804583 RepID=UPI003CF98652
MPRASAADAARTAERILGRASAQFAAQGVAAVSLDDVARAAGVTRGAVYHHFGSKAGVLAAVVDRLHGEVAERVVAAADEAGEDPLDRLRAGSHAFLDAITARATARILLVDAPAILGWEAWRQSDAEHSGAHLRDALEELGVSADLLEALAAQLSGAMNESAVWVAAQPDPAAALRSAHSALDRLLRAAVD